MGESKNAEALCQFLRSFSVQFHISAWLIEHARHESIASFFIFINSAAMFLYAKSPPSPPSILKLVQLIHPYIPLHPSTLFPSLWLLSDHQSIFLFIIDQSTPLTRLGLELVPWCQMTAFATMGLDIKSIKFIWLMLYAHDTATWQGQIMNKFADTASIIRNLWLQEHEKS